MLILTIRTDKPEAEIGLYENGRRVAYETWLAHRQLAETIHSQIEKVMRSSEGKDLDSLDGIAVYKGPGSFTGLRIGLSVGNALAYSLNIPIEGATGEAWIRSALEELEKGGYRQIALPDYGAPVHITKPNK